MSEYQDDSTSPVESDAPDLNEVDNQEYDDVNEVTEGTVDEDSSGDEQPEATIDDSEEIEFNQKQFKLPKEIAQAVRDMQKDYTVKTQAVAEQRKQFEAQVQFQQQNIQDVAQYHTLDNQLKEFEKVDLIALSAEDPVRAQQLMLYKQSIESQRNSLASTISQRNQQSTLEKQQTFAKQLEESESVLRRDIKDWSSDKERSLQDFAVKNYGFDPDEVRNAKVNPELYKLLNDAYIGKQIIQKQTAKPKIVPKAEPVPVVSGRAAKVSKAPHEMTPNEYVKWRRQGYA